MKNSLGIYAHSVFLGIRKNGVWETIKLILIALIDIVEDFFRGIKAHKFVDSKEVMKGKESADFANFYQPVRSVPFRSLFKKLNIPTDGNFVDIGAGTGKAMLLALAQGFKRVRGIELVDDLVVIANENKKNHNISDDSFECIAGDALNFKFEESDKVFFFNDPFSDEVFSKFLENLINHKKSLNKEIILIYKNNSSRDIKSFYKLMNKNKSESLNLFGNLYEVVWLKNED